MFKKNLDTRDRVIRLVLAFVILCLAVWQKSWIAYAVSIFVFFEALMSWCLYYQLTGKSSCPIDSQKK